MTRLTFIVTACQQPCQRPYGAPPPTLDHADPIRPSRWQRWLDDGNDPLLASAMILFGISVVIGTLSEILSIVAGSAP